MCGIYCIFGPYDQNIVQTDASAIQHRGPDNTVTHEFEHGCIVFHRLSIMDVTPAGNQPFVGRLWTLVCNGEIYNAKELQQRFIPHVKMHGHSDCEVIWQILEHGVLSFTELVAQLYGVYSICAVCDDHHVFLARDRVGVRPLYWAVGSSVAVASEPCALARFGSLVQPFPPDSVMYFKIRSDGTHTEPMCLKSAQLCLPTLPTISKVEDATKLIRSTIENAVRVRMMSDRPIACLLSGGVDSSTVAALVAKFSDHPIHTFSIGMEGSTDLRYARILADHIKSVHHEVLLTEKDFIDAVPDVIRIIQSYDVTTVRASTPMYLLSKYIRENTDFKVIFSGEGPDEVCGSYMYFHAAPSAEAADMECRRLVQDMHYFDVLRADRSTARCGLEVRVPFLGVDFIQAYWSIDPKLRLPQERVEKWLLRSSVEDLMPKEICWRPKEGMSDGIASLKRSWFQILQEYINDKVSDEQLASAPTKFPHHTPHTKEAFWMREMYEKFYPGMAHLIPYQWLPKWCGNVLDPSARVLKQYKQQ